MPAQHIFHKKATYRSLCGMLGQFTCNALFATTVLPLLKDYLENGENLNDLTNHAKLQIVNAPVLNEGLLSMTPQIFAQAVVDLVNHFLHARIGEKLSKVGKQFNQI
jgi:hypothetical protein